MAKTNEARDPEIMQAAMERVAEEQVQQKAPKKKPSAAAAAKGPRQAKATVTYIPLEDGDLPFTMWHGIKFAANVAREVNNPDLIESAKTNPWFSVDGKPPVKRPKQLPPRDDSEDAHSKPLAANAKELELTEDGVVDENAS